MSSVNQFYAGTEDRDFIWFGSNFFGNGNLCTASVDGKRINLTATSLKDCIEQVREEHPEFIEKIETSMGETFGNKCNVPDFDPLFSAIYSVIPIIFGCSIVLKILKKVFSATD